MSKLLPVGAQTYSKAPERYPDNAPQTTNAADGAWVYQQLFTEGLVDLTSGLGAVILGHRHPSVEDAIEQQLRRGISFPLPTDIETEAAETLLDCLSWQRAESVRFAKNGADVTGSAVRLARAVTGREYVFYNGYHGHHDWSMTEPPMNGGVLWQASHRIMWDPNDQPATIRSLQEKFEDNPPAALVLEAVPSANPLPMPHQFWGAIRLLCDQFGVLLVIDEMVTGFRIAVGGACEEFAIEPDIACYGKAMANGMPLSAIVGPWDILKRYEKDVFFSTTHGGEALSLAAAVATMTIVRDLNVPEKLGELGRRVLAAATGSYGYPQRVLFKYSKEQLNAMTEAGVLTAGYANLTLAHVEDATAQYTIFAAIEAAEALT